jgi:HAMP domain-containing protein
MNLPGATELYTQSLVPRYPPARTALDALMALQRQRGEALYRATQQRYQQVFWLSVAAMCLGLLVAGVAGVTLVRAIARPLAQAVQAAQHVAAGDLSQDIPTSPARHETGQLLQALHARLLLIAQFVQLSLPGLLFFLFVLALFQVLQALGKLLVEGEERIGRVVVEGLERFLWQYAGQVVQALLQQLFVVGQGLVLLLQMALGLLLGVVGRLQLLVQAGGVFLQGQQGALAFLVLADFFIQATQLAVEPGATGLVVLRGEGWP